MNKNFTIPNALSIVRLLMIPVIIYCYLKHMYLSAFILLCLSALTDIADGNIARHFDQISDLGKILDPLADKLTMAAVVLSLSFYHIQLRLLLGVLILKEMLMIAGGYALIKMGKRPSESKIWGKISTFMLYFLMALLMISDALASYWQPSGTLLWVFSVVCCIFMIMALVQYYPIFIGIKSGKYDIHSENFIEENAEKNDGSPRK